MTERGNLVKLLEMDQDFIVDLRYATENNFTGKKIYESGQCYMDRHTAEILIRAKNIFKRDGYMVKVWDAYRPISAQKRFWEIMPDDNFVARPPDAMTEEAIPEPTHMSGQSVDVTLTDMCGKEIEMPSGFDDFSEKASLSCPDITDAGRRNARYLKDVMESVGFQSYDKEWWHFEDISAEPIPPLDFPL